MKRRVLSLVAVVALGLAASAGAQADKPIVIGAALSLTGKLADAGTHVKNAYELWVDDVNGRGGLLGRKVQLVTYDDRSEPGTSSKLYERLIASDKVDLLLGPFGSGATAAASTVTEKHRMVMLAPAAAAESIFQRGYRYVFQVTTPMRFYIEGVFPIAVKEGYKTIALVTRDYDASRDMGKAIKEWAPANGMDVVMFEFFPAGTTDYSSYIVRAKGVKPDVWVCVCYPGEAIEQVRQMKAANYTPKMYVAQGVAQEEFLKGVGRDAEFAFGMSLYEPYVNTRGNGEFVRKYRERYKREPGYYDAFSIAAAQVLEQAVRQVGTLDQDKIRDAVRTLKTETPFGPFAVDDTGAQVAKKGLIVQVLKGKREVVWPFEQKTAAYVLPAPGWTQR